VVDKYGELVILQLLAKGLDSAAVRETCVRVLCEELAPVAILERPDPRMRELEGLAAPSAEPLFVAANAQTASTQFLINGLVFHYDANAGQKTGAFLDQRPTTPLPSSGRGGSALPAVRWTFVATRAVLPCIWPRSAARLPVSMPHAPRSK